MNHPKDVYFAEACHARTISKQDISGQLILIVLILVDQLL